MKWAGLLNFGDISGMSHMFPHKNSEIKEAWEWIVGQLKVNSYLAGARAPFWFHIWSRLVTACWVNLDYTMTNFGLLHVLMIQDDVLYRFRSINLVPIGISHSNQNDWGWYQDCINVWFQLFLHNADVRIETVVWSANLQKWREGLCLISAFSIDRRRVVKVNVGFGKKTKVE